jgi:hypothetical protein
VDVNTGIELVCLEATFRRADDRAQDFTPHPSGRPAFSNLGVTRPGVQVQSLNISAASYLSEPRDRSSPSGRVMIRRVGCTLGSLLNSTSRAGLGRVGCGFGSSWGFGAGSCDSDNSISYHSNRQHDHGEAETDGGDDLTAKHATNNRSVPLVVVLDAEGQVFHSFGFRVSGVTPRHDLLGVHGGGQLVWQRDVRRGEHQAQKADERSNLADSPEYPDWPSGREAED